MPNICIISETPDLGQLESFIQAHLDRLDGRVHFLYGAPLPLYSGDRQPLADYQSRITRTLKSLGLLSRSSKREMDARKLGLINYLRRHRIDVVLAEYGVTGARVFETCKMLDIPFVVHFHGYDISIHEVIESHEKLYLEMFKYASKVVCVSEDMADDLVRCGANESKIVLNPYGPNPSFYNNKPDHSANNFLVLGRLVNKKAPCHTLMAFKQVLREFPSLRLNVIGDGYLREACEDLCQSQGISSSVDFLGELPHEDVLGHFSNAFCFLQHSVVAQDGDSEGTPVAILEAQAAGLPVVSTRHKGIKQAVIHGKSGYLCDEHDVPAMAGFMKLIAGDRTLARNLGMHGRKHIKERFSLDRHIDVLNETIANSHAEHERTKWTTGLHYHDGNSSQAACLEEAMRSVQGQSFRDHEEETGSNPMKRFARFFKWIGHDLSAELISAMCRVRSLIELFLRMFKPLLGCRHLLSTKRNAIEIQAYGAIIGCLLILIHTGRTSTKRTFEVICFYLLGWAILEELEAQIQKPKPQNALDRYAPSGSRR